MKYGLRHIQENMCYGMSSTVTSSIEDVIRAPPTMYSDANVLLNRCKVLQDQLDELRRQVESYMEGPR